MYMTDPPLVKKSLASYWTPCLQDVAISRCVESKNHDALLYENLSIFVLFIVLGSNNFPDTSISTILKSDLP
jgi:hypothetical protein